MVSAIITQLPRTEHSFLPVSYVVEPQNRHVEKCQSQASVSDWVVPISLPPFDSLDEEVGTLFGRRLHVVHIFVLGARLVVVVIRILELSAS